MATIALQDRLSNNNVKTAIGLQEQENLAVLNAKQERPALSEKKKTVLL